MLTHIKVFLLLPTRLEDVPLLDRTTALGRILFSQDDGLLAIARARQT